MPLTYRDAGPWGSGKGAKLTIAEGDGNIYDLDQRVTANEEALTNFSNVDDIVREGNDLVIKLTDGREFAFAIPVPEILFAGEWTPDTEYAPNTEFTFGAEIYLVIWPHTSAAEFDPGANDGEGHDYYRRRLGLIYTAPVLNITESTLTLGLEHRGRHLRCTSEVGALISIPTDDPFQINDEIHVCQATDGIVLFDWSTPSVTVNFRDGFSAVIGGRFGVVTLKKVAAAEYDLFGALAPVSESPVSE